jgi:hypothetical protein
MNHPIIYLLLTVGFGAVVVRQLAWLIVHDRDALLPQQHVARRPHQYDWEREPERRPPAPPVPPWYHPNPGIEEWRK